MSHADQHIRQITSDYFGMDIDDALLARFGQVQLEGGEWLFHHGDPGDSLYFVVRGRLQVWDESIHDEDGEPRLLGEVVPGESVGEVGLLSGAARSAGIRAIRDSLLLRLDRQTFEQLAREHPALVMKLAANIAQLLQRSTSKAASSIRKLSTISLMPLSDSPSIAEFCQKLVRSLESHGDCLYLARSGLGRAGAPVSSLSDRDSVPDSLLHWLHDQENEHRYLVYQCDASASPWTRLATRQSDIVL